jgi:hypothetical protein
MFKYVAKDNLPERRFFPARVVKVVTRYRKIGHHARRYAAVRSDKECFFDILRTKVVVDVRRRQMEEYTHTGSMARVSDIEQA